MSTGTRSFAAEEAVRRAGVSRDLFEEMVRLGIVHADADGRFSASQIRRAQMAQTLDRAGVPLDGLAAGIASGEVSLSFFDSPDYERFPLLSDETFAQLSERTGVPFELLSAMREASGFAPAQPADQLRETEIQMAEFLAIQIRLGFRPIAIERLIRVMGDSLRRIADQEASWWRSEVIEPSVAAGARGEQLGGRFAFEESNRLGTLAEEFMIATYNAHRTRAWTSNIVSTLEIALDRAGLHSRLDRPPAICFLDVTGYTRLTQERGDEAAAGLAEQLNRLVSRTAGAHGGRPIKWLGDGVMLYFNDPGAAVTGSLDLLAAVAAAGLPPAHVGVHAGPVLFQEGDYFGSTVNIASRIGEYARPGELLVSEAVVNAAPDAAVFTRIGPVELKGVAGATVLFSAAKST